MYRFDTYRKSLLAKKLGSYLFDNEEYGIKI